MFLVTAGTDLDQSYYSSMQQVTPHMTTWAFIYTGSVVDPAQLYVSVVQVADIRDN